MSTIKYAEMDVNIHGLDTPPELLETLRKTVEDSVRATLRAHPEFGWRDDYEDDLEVEIDVTAGGAARAGK